MLLANTLDACDYEYESFPADKLRRLYYITCPVCNYGSVRLLTDLEDLITCDSQNPDDEMFLCSGCDNETHLTATSIGVRELFSDNEYQMVSDGTFLLLKDKEGKLWRI